MGRQERQEDVAPIHLAWSVFLLKFREKLIDLICRPDGKFFVRLLEAVQLRIQLLHFIQDGRKILGGKGHDSAELSRRMTGFTFL
jgi:hypothetical protein